MWSRRLFQIVKYSLDSWRSSLSKAKCPIHLHEGYMNCEAVNSLNTYTHFIRDPGSLFWWLVTIRRPRCVFVSFSTKWTGISIVEAKYDTFIFALVWRTQTFIEWTRKMFLYTRGKKSPKMMCDTAYLAWIPRIFSLNISHVAYVSFFFSNSSLNRQNLNKISWLSAHLNFLLQNSPLRAE